MCVRAAVDGVVKGTSTKCDQAKVCVCACATRKEAAATKWSFFEKNAREIRSIFDNMVKVRHKMAVSLGYKNFVELGYNRMLRSDYNAEMVAVFRKQVQDYIVPIATELRQRQAKRLGLDSLKYYDESFKFKTGLA